MTSSTVDSAVPASSGARTSTRPTVLHVRVVIGTGGGADKTVVNSPRFLTGMGYDCVCAYMRAPSDSGYQQILNRANQADAEVVSIDDRGLLDFRVFFKLLRLCRERRVTIWHAHEYKSNLLGLMLRRFWKMHLVTTVHGWVSTGGRMDWYYKLDRRLLKFYERVICVSKDLHRGTISTGVPEDRCLYLNNGIDHLEFQRRTESDVAKASFGIPAGRIVIGAVGRLAQRRGSMF